MKQFDLKKFIKENKATFHSSLSENNKEYYKDAEADDAEHIDALEKDMKDDKKSSKMKVSELKAKIKEMVLAEAKDDEEEEEVTDEEEVDVDVEDPEPTEEPMGDGGINVTQNADADLTGKEKEVQDNLEAALKAAQELNDEKLQQQIGNSLTFFTRTHVVKENLRKYLAKGRLHENVLAQKLRDEATQPDSKVGAAIFNKYAEKVEKADKKDYYKLIKAMENELISKHPDTFSGEDDIPGSFLADLFN